MSNRYEQFSKTKQYEKAYIVEKCNKIDMDKMQKAINKQCESCRNCCPNFSDEPEECKNYSRRMTLKEINKEIKKQNINIKRICNDYNLSRNLMYEMIKGRRTMKYTYYCALEDTLLENDEYIPHLEAVYE